MNIEPQPSPPHIDTRRRSIIIWLVVMVVVIAALVVAGFYLLNSVGNFFRVDLVNCKTFRGELAKVDAQFEPAYRPIERDVQCIAGLDAPDKGKITFVSDTEIFRDETILKQEVASRFQAVGWTQTSGTDTFSKNAKAENKDVIYIAVYTIISANPAVIRLTFTPNNTAFADFGSKQDYSPDIPLTNDDKRHYNAMQYALEQVLPQFQIKERKVISLTEVQIPLEHITPHPDSARSNDLTLILSLATAETNASRCGGHVEKDNADLVCESLGSTASGREVFIANPAGNPPRRTLSNAYASFGNVDAALMGGHPAVSGLSTEETLQLFEAIVPRRL